MAFILADRVKETSVTSGLGSVVLNGPFGGFQSFAAGIGDGNSTYYAIENETQWEVGIGTYSAGSNSISRDQVLASSNSNNKITLNGVSIVFCTYAAGRSIYFNGQDLVDFRGHSGIIVDRVYDSSNSSGASGQALVSTSTGTAWQSTNLAYLTVSGNYSLSLNNEVIFLDASTTDLSIDLPSASGAGGKEFYFKKKPGIYSITINAPSGQTIDGQINFAINYDYEAISIISDNTNWYVF